MPLTWQSLFEDDGNTFNYEAGAFNTVQLSWDGRKGKVVRSGKFKHYNYLVKSWKLIH